MASHHKNSNAINGLCINVEWSQDLGEIRKEAELYHVNLFKEEVPLCPLLDGLEFDRISEVEKG